MTLLHTIRADPKERALYEVYCKQLSIDQTIKDDMAELRAEAESERALRAQLEGALAAEQARAAQALEDKAQAASALAEEQARVEALRAKLRALGLDPDAGG